MNLFPSGIAEGEAFCNRGLERKRLASNISGIKHTALMAPRRYGKTSLVRQTLLDNKFNYVWVDFLSVTNTEDIKNKISKASNDLLLQLSPELKKLRLHTKEIVQSMSPELNLSALGQSLRLHFSIDKKITVDEALLELDEYAQKIGKTAVLVFDEFQQISEIKQNESLEALIRHAVERSKAITYIFSGSNRHLLTEMFSQSTRPLYRLCQVMTVDRIDISHYKQFLNSAAKKQWCLELSDEVITTILKLTERHPFYVNALCSELWLRETAPNKEADVLSAWQWYVNTHKSMVAADVINLALNQKKIVMGLASEPTKEPFGTDFCVKIKLSPSSVHRAIEALLLKDIIYINSSGIYGLLDPALRYYLLHS